MDSLFIYQRTVFLADTDAAGVVYFANLLSICHEAYEAFLLSQGWDLRCFYEDKAIAIPIVHATIDIRRAIFAGDSVVVHLHAEQPQATELFIYYHIKVQEQLVASGHTRHVCINPSSRERTEVPLKLLQSLKIAQY